MVSYMCPVSSWWGGERREVEEKVRTGEWRKRSGKEENDASKTGILLKEKHIMECSCDKRVVFMCLLMSLLSSDVSICQILVFQRILKCYRNVTNQQNCKYAKPMLSPPVSNNKITGKKGLCWNKWEMVCTAWSKRAVTALISERWNVHSCICDGSGQYFTALTAPSLQICGFRKPQSVGWISMRWKLLKCQTANETNEQKTPVLKWHLHGWDGILRNSLEAACRRLGSWPQLLSVPAGSVPVLFAVFSPSSLASLSRLRCLEAFP